MLRWRDVWSREFALMVLAFATGDCLYGVLKWLFLLVWR